MGDDMRVVGWPPRLIVLDDGSKGPPPHRMDDESVARTHVEA